MSEETPNHVPGHSPEDYDTLRAQLRENPDSFHPDLIPHVKNLLGRQPNTVSQGSENRASVSYPETQDNTAGLIETTNESTGSSPVLSEHGAESKRIEVVNKASEQEARAILIESLRDILLTVEKLNQPSLSEQDKAALSSILSQAEEMISQLKLQVTVKEAKPDTSVAERRKITELAMANAVSPGAGKYPTPTSRTIDLLRATREATAQPSDDNPGPKVERTTLYDLVGQSARPGGTLRPQRNAETATAAKQDQEVKHLSYGSERLPSQDTGPTKPAVGVVESHTQALRDAKDKKSGIINNGDPQESLSPDGSDAGPAAETDHPIEDNAELAGDFTTEQTQSLRGPDDGRSLRERLQESRGTRDVGTENTQAAEHANPDKVAVQDGKPKPARAKWRDRQRNRKGPAGRKPKGFGGWKKRSKVNKRVSAVGNLRVTNGVDT